MSTKNRPEDDAAPLSSSADGVLGSQGRLTDDALTEPRSVYARLRQVFGDGAHRRSMYGRGRPSGGKPASSVPFGDGRDPHGLADVIDDLTTNLGWNSPLARSELLSSWQQIVGMETAEHSTPIGIDDGVLTVSCDSTAWATQLRLMRERIIRQVVETFPAAGIDSVRFEGPNAPSWKRGPRSIPGRGPRDTYG